MSAAPRRVLRAVIGLFAITAFGTVGYMWVEGLSFLDALYMTVITVATVGYGEVRPLHPEGRIFTIVLIVSAASTAAYLFTQIAQALVESSLREVLSRRAMDKKIAELREPRDRVRLRSPRPRGGRGSLAQRGAARDHRERSRARARAARERPTRT